MSSAGVVPILGPDGVVRDIPQDQAGAAMAAGGKTIARVIDPQGVMRDVPHDQLDQAQAQGGTAVKDDGSFVVTPAPNESFADTMKRAAAAGKNVTSQLLQQQTTKGVQDAPIALGAAAVAGPAMLGAETGAYDLAGSAGNLAKYYGPQALQNPVVQHAIKMAGAGLVGRVGWGLGEKLLKSIGLITGPAMNIP